MNLEEIYNRQYQLAKIKLNEQETTLPGRKVSSSSIGRSSTQDVQRPNDEFMSPEEERKVREAETRTQYGTEKERIARAYDQYYGQNWDAIAAARETAALRGQQRGEVSQETVKKATETAKKEKEEAQSQVARDKAYDTATQVVDLVQTAAAVPLLFSGAGTPYAAARLAKTAAGFGASMLGAQAGTDLYRGTMEDDPRMKEYYTKRGLERGAWAAAAPVLGLAIGKGIEQTGKVAKAAAQTETGKKAIEAARQVPGVGKAEEAVKAAKALPQSDTGGMAGGVAGLAAGAVTVSPDDSMATAAAKTVAGALLGQALGSRAASFMKGKIPAVDVPVSTAVKTVLSPKERTAELVAAEIAKAADVGPVPQGYTTITPRIGKEFPATKEGIRQKPEPIQVPSDEPMGVWQPAPGSNVGTGLSRRGASTQDVGYPPYPETHVSVAPQEVVTPRKWQPGDAPPRPVKRVPNESRNPNAPEWTKLAPKTPAQTPAPKPKALPQGQSPIPTESGSSMPSFIPQALKDIFSPRANWTLGTQRRRP